ncbi:hypothetical protein F5887DRAFT_1059972 [Amanita rubescens]|nr:hypothetical protein F5887DRAFT_1059972 [Amanita rubescens]
MSTPILIGVGALAAAFAGRALVRRGFLSSKGASEQWIKGGFQSKMDRKEAIAILGLKDGPKIRTSLKDAHRQIMLANHPDPWCKINEAKDLIEKLDGKGR